MAVKRIAVLVRDRQSEALRMALGLTLVDDQVDVYLLDRLCEPSKDDALNLELMKDLGIGLYFCWEDGPGGETLTRAEIARRLLDYSHILPY